MRGSQGGCRSWFGHSQWLGAAFPSRATESGAIRECAALVVIAGQLVMHRTSDASALCCPFRVPPRSPQTQSATK